MRTAKPFRRIFQTVIGVGALVVLLVAGGALLFRSLRPAPSRPSADAPAFPGVEIPRAELHLRDGHLYHNADSNPFTGWMFERYQDGALKSRSTVSNGLLHGLSQGWQTNGQLQITEHFQQGVSHGLRTKWHPNGVKLSEGEIVAGKFHGPFRHWSETGSLIEQVELVAGQPDGVALAYYPSGFLKTRARSRNGKVIETKSWNDHEQKEPVLAER